jgi:uncharacterized membrane protein HdeD (DUF308 family)
LLILGVSPMPSTSITQPEVRARFTVAYLIAEGALLIVLGAAALGFPVLASIATAVLVGWILVASGVIGLVGAFMSKPHVHFGWSLVSSGLAIAAGLAVAIFPLAGVITLIVVTATWLTLDGVSALMIGRHLRQAGSRAWGWSIVSAIIDWVLAAGLLLLGPFVGLYAVGMVVGVDLFLGGVALLGLATHPRPRAG